MHLSAQKIDGKRKRKSTPVDKTTKKDPRLDVSLKAGRILTIGQGDFGQLGLGEEILERKRPAPIKDVDGIKFVQIVCGGMHTVGVSDKGEVYTWGCNDEGALGRPTDGENGEDYFPRKIVLADGVIVVNVSAGDSHSTALTSDGEVYIWGAYRDANGQIGLTSASLGAKNEIVKVYPTSNDHCSPAVKVVSGNDHTVILTEDGSVFTSGTGEQGQLGRIKSCFGHRGGRRGLDFILKPHRVRFRKKIRIADIFCGSFTTYAMCRDTNNVYAWGLNNYGQLGNGTNVDSFNPEIVKPLSAIRKTSEGYVRIDGGQHHALVLDTEGVTYSIGRFDYGRLGLGKTSTETSLPTKIPALDGTIIKQIACGDAVSFAISDDGKLYSWGLGTNLQLGVGDEEDIFEPTLVTSKNVNPDSEEVISVSAGGQHTAVLLRSRVESISTNGT